MVCPASAPRFAARAATAAVLPAVLATTLVTMLVAAPAACQAGPDTPAALPGTQLRLALGPRTSMVYEPRPLAPRQPLVVPPEGAAPSLGLEFKSPPRHDGPRSLLRVQLSGDAALQFRPRRGGLAVSYRTEF